MLLAGWMPQSSIWKGYGFQLFLMPGFSDANLDHHIVISSSLRLFEAQRLYSYRLRAGSVSYDCAKFGRKGCSRCSMVGSVRGLHKPLLRHSKFACDPNSDHWEALIFIEEHVFTLTLIVLKTEAASSSEIYLLCLITVFISCGRCRTCLWACKSSC